MTVAEQIGITRSRCRSALTSRPLAEVNSFLEKKTNVAEDLLRESTASNSASPRLLDLQQSFTTEAAPPDPSAFARALLIRASLTALDQLPTLAVPDSVKRLFCDQFSFYTQPPETKADPFVVTGYPFVALSRLALLERFPGGQHDWEISGFSRRWMASVGLRKLPELAWLLGAEVRGFKPYFIQHLAIANRRPRFLTEREYLKFFYRMAAAIERQPSIRAIMGCSWLHSPETHRINPHLAFLNRPHLEAGGMRVDLGPASETAGYLAGDKNREELYRSGKFKPTRSVVICSRRQAIWWKNQHPELDTEKDTN
jgi:hypothetical protein